VAAELFLLLLPDPQVPGLCGAGSGESTGAGREVSQGAFRALPPGDCGLKHCAPSTFLVPSVEGS
jgi:hypothetical protein